MDDFYKKTGGITLLVIQHLGQNFQYANGNYTASFSYSNKWDPILPLMTKGKFYVIPCIVKENSHKAKLIPFGVAFQMGTKEEAQKISYQHLSDVKSGKWDAEYEFKRLILDCATYQKEFFSSITNNLNKVISQHLGV